MLVSVRFPRVYILNNITAVLLLPLLRADVTVFSSINSRTSLERLRKSLYQNLD